MGLNGGTGNKCSRCHNDLCIISRHIPGFRCHMTVYRCRRLNSLAEADNPLRLTEGHCLNDIVSALTAVRYYRKT